MQAVWGFLKETALQEQALLVPATDAWQVSWISGLDPYSLFAFA